LNLDPAVAVAPNKLTAKVATRTLRPSGFAAIRGDEVADFLAFQDISLLPGIGPALKRLLQAAGIYRIGDLATLHDVEGRALLGRNYSRLLDAARGIDRQPVYDESERKQLIQRQLYFQGDVADKEVLRGSLFALVEDAGMELRSRRLTANALKMHITYADGIQRQLTRCFNRPLSLDNHLFVQAEYCLTKILDRRIRIRHIAIEFDRLGRDYHEQDLFIPDDINTEKRFQEALDTSRRRFGPAAIIRGTTLLAQQNSGALRVSHH
jgi:DNA polymerase-4